MAAELLPVPLRRAQVVSTLMTKGDPVVGYLQQHERRWTKMSRRVIRLNKQQLQLGELPQIYRQPAFKSDRTVPRRDDRTSSCQRDLRRACDAGLQVGRNCARAARQSDHRGQDLPPNQITADLDVAVDGAWHRSNGVLVVPGTNVTRCRWCQAPTATAGGGPGVFAVGGITTIPVIVLRLIFLVIQAAGDEAELFTLQPARDHRVRLAAKWSGALHR